MLMLFLFNEKKTVYHYELIVLHLAVTSMHLVLAAHSQHKQTLTQTLSFSHVILSSSFHLLAK